MTRRNSGMLFKVQFQEKRANSQIHGLDYEYAKGEERKARSLVKSKRIEIDSLNKAKIALSIQDINRHIRNMDHIIQHETLPLKKEKQLIHEIKQLEQLREQLVANLGNQDEIKQALEHRDEAEDCLKLEAAAVEAEKKYNTENKKNKGTSSKGQSC